MSIKVYLSPSDQSRNTYAYGNTNEAEQCGKIAEACRVALERCGIAVKVGHMLSMAEKCAQSNAYGADLHVPIHTNAFNGTVSGTRLFCYNSTGNGYKACKSIYDALAPLTPGTSENIRVDAELYEVKVPAAPTAYIECEFHDHPESSRWIVEHTSEIGEAIAHGICTYFGIPYAENTPPLPLSAQSSSGSTVSVALPKLAQGDSGAAVKTLQTLLNLSGADLEIDGGFGPKTHQAVLTFQRKRNLDIDGIVGKQTWPTLIG